MLLSQFTPSRKQRDADGDEEGQASSSEGQVAGGERQPPRQNNRDLDPEYIEQGHELEIHAGPGGVVCISFAGLMNQTARMGRREL